MTPINGLTVKKYQEDSLNELARKIASGANSVIYQLSTGGGKTVVMSTMCKRMWEKKRTRALVVVHRKELIVQIRKTLMSWYGIPSCVVGGRKALLDVPVFVGMAGTISNILKKSPNYFSMCSITIFDECHRGEFKKLFPIINSIKVGFSATPISGSKKDPLINYYKDIVCGIDTHELISEGALLPNITWAPKIDIDRESLHTNKAGTDFNENEMGTEFSKERNIKNTIDKYKEKADGRKAIVFNCDISHSKLMTEAFIAAGYECRHLDSKMLDSQRDENISWFRNTKGAILCNVDIATTGFDEPSIGCVIVNRCTMSLTLWLQMTGRGSRPFPGMEDFIIIDMGGNALVHGDWNEPRDWQGLFFNPPQPAKNKSAAPVKSCPSCDAIIHASMTKCVYCGYIIPPPKINYDADKFDLEIVTKKIDVDSIVRRDKGFRNEWASLFEIGDIIARNVGKDKQVTAKEYEKIILTYRDKAREWATANGKPFTVGISSIAKNKIKSLLSINNVTICQQ